MVINHLLNGMILQVVILEGLKPRGDDVMMMSVSFLSESDPVFFHTKKKPRDPGSPKLRMAMASKYYAFCR